MNKLILLFALIFLMGCRSKSKFIEKERIGAEIERISQVEIKAEKQQKKDSVIQKKEIKEATDQATNIKVDFDPKKDDSLEVNYQLGTDSLKLKIHGNGKVSFDFKSNKTKTTTESKEIFGSETLFNIDSTFSEKSAEKIKVESKKSTKAVKETDFSFWIYVIIGGAVLAIIALFWFFGKPKK